MVSGNFNLKTISLIFLIILNKNFYLLLNFLLGLFIFIFFIFSQTISF